MNTELDGRTSCIEADQRQRNGPEHELVEKPTDLGKGVLSPPALLALRNRDMIAKSDRPHSRQRAPPSESRCRADAMLRSGSGVLEHQRDALARADAHAEDAVARAALAQFRGEREYIAGTG
jgi:hypothetical protein